MRGSSLRLLWRLNAGAAQGDIRCAPTGRQIGRAPARKEHSPALQALPGAPIGDCRQRQGNWSLGVGGEMMSRLPACTHVLRIRVFFGPGFPHSVAQYRCDPIGVPSVHSTVQQRSRHVGMNGITIGCDLSRQAQNSRYITVASDAGGFRLAQTAPPNRAGRDLNAALTRRQSGPIENDTDWTATRHARGSDRAYRAVTIS